MVSIANKYSETPIDKAKMPLREILKGKRDQLHQSLPLAAAGLSTTSSALLPNSSSASRACREAGPEPDQDPLQGHLLEGHDPHAAP